MEQEILKEWQKKTIDFVFSKIELSDFYLTGGTALAGYYLYHRISDDLDFFSFGDFDLMYIHGIAEELRKVIGAEKVRFSKLYDRNQFFYFVDKEELKIEFTKYPFKQLEKAGVFDNARIDSEFDIAVNKLITITDRFDPKDFVDLFFLLQKYPLGKLQKGVSVKFNTKLDPLTIGSSFAKIKNVEALPKMIKTLSVEEVKEFFNSEAKKLSPLVLV
ncbi:MAG: nucleotidyl transferase AbiEii/AbiGii toxin family protein [bacterium]|nr:nucleotidyl transferase AbiEii/AbiGii toxin family protein [bacterium]